MGRLAFYRRWKLGEDPHALAKEAGVTRERMRHMLAKMDAEVPLVDQIDAAQERIAELERMLVVCEEAGLAIEEDAVEQRARAEAAEARVKVLEEALRELDKAASEVARHGAQTGPQWSKLTIASLKARAALEGEK